VENKKSHISRTVVLLGMVSLFADFASEMVYPILPIYLKEINFSFLMIGLLEGVSELAAGLGKGYFGSMSDYLGKRMPFVRFGYAFSAISKPLMALFTFPVWIYGVRFFDRLGKGMRTGARDAMLSQSSTPETKAQVFAFHRGLDTLGSVFGPLVLLVALYFYQAKYTTLFYIAFIPGVVSVALLFFMKEPKTKPRPGHKPKFFSFVRYWKIANPEYKKLVIGLLIFTMFNSSDVFLLLKIKEATNSDALTIGAFMLYSLVYALASYPIGIIADDFSMKQVLIGGLFIFAAVYFGFALSDNKWFFFYMLFLYGVYAAATEGVAKAWISNLARRQETATALGFFTAFQSMATMIASSITGFLWMYYGPMIALGTSAFMAIFAAVYLMYNTSKSNIAEESAADESSVAA
jgi:MFS family permease